ncbi:MAG: SUMF1/EgtB/PvdO family nonheme iron enzyme [Candidatus Schekmanbacteria bacterium]|nr:SUMF1/EgtB/PvdO family nonheme iron enzyme [Candidatus Schekmanbacteria bacterium]
MNETAIDLADALRGLEVAVRELRQETARFQARLPARLERLDKSLTAAVAAIPAASCRRLTCPPDYTRQWEDWLARRRPNLDPRAIRYLCWEPSVAISPRFQDVLDHAEADLSARALHGLVHSCHARWCGDLAGGSIVRRIRGRLEAYRGKNRVIGKWRASSRYLLGPDAPGALGTRLVGERGKVEALCKDWGLDPGSPFVAAVVRDAAAMIRASGQAEPTRYLIDELLPWPGLGIEDFKAEVAATILHAAGEPSAGPREALKVFILREPRLGDPRLPRNRAKWHAVPENAQRRFVEWMSAADIRFFFDHVLPDGLDWHGRKAFWLQYVDGNALLSRPLLCESDRRRLMPELGKNEEAIGHFGRIRGQQGVSAFVLDFGSVVAIEFSKMGRCYFYDHATLVKLVGDVWADHPFAASELKHTRTCLDSVAHLHGWEDRMSDILAGHGVHRGRLSSPSPGLRAGESGMREPRDPRIDAIDPMAGQMRHFELTPGVSVQMVWVPPGKFWMGADRELDSMAYANERPRHEIEITQGFWLGAFPVTQGQWQGVVGLHPSSFKGANFPVESVSWENVRWFMTRVNSGGASTYRLPTEAEWEYACRAGTMTSYSFGKDSVVNDHAWYESNSRGATHPVGAKRPNAWGLYDMLGNVFEWVEDSYDEFAYSRHAPQNPINHSPDSRRVARGGCYHSGFVQLRVTHRLGVDQWTRFRDVGFRLVRSGA